jgi:DNA-binding PadR family transcriptional regulator
MANTKKIDYVILGLLSHESLTGYDIKQRMDSGLSLFWGASYGSIYPTLNLLLKNGLITSENVSQNKRDKIQYTITPNGKEKLLEWLKLPVEKDEIRYETLLKLFFAGDNTAKSTVEHLEAFETKIKKELQMLQFFAQNLEHVKEQDDAHLYYLLTIKFGIQTYEGYLKWCKEAKAEIKKRSKGAVAKLTN